MKFADSALDTLRLNYAQLFVAEKKVASFIIANVPAVLHMNVSDLAAHCGASEATVIRMCKHLGYKGFYQLKLMLAHNLGQDAIIGSGLEQQNPETPEDFFKCLANNMYHIGGAISPEVLQRCVQLICNCATVHIVAAGNTIPQSIDFAFRLGRIGISTSSSVSDEIQLGNINLAKPSDIVIGISHSGGSKSVLKAFEMAKKRNIPTIAITDIVDTPLSMLATLSLPSGIEVSGSDLFGAESHIHTAAVLDALLFFLAKSKRSTKPGGGLEMFLVETTL